MLSVLLTVAVFAAVIVVAVRLLKQLAAERSRPGRSAASAIPIDDFGEIDLTVRLATCPCGGRFVLRGEAPVADAQRSLRVAIVECRRCEREQRIFFDLSEVRH